MAEVHVRRSEVMRNGAESDSVSKKRRALLVVNENSRQGQQAAVAANEILESGGIVLQRENCDGPDQLIATVLRAANSIDIVILGGGDGTLNSIIPALIETGLPLGILPLGTANDLARTLEIPADPAAAAKVIVAGNIRQIDLGDVNGKLFFNVASLGLSTQLTHALTSDIKRRWGRLGYAIATFRALSRMRPFWAEIRAEGKVHTVRTMQISVGNGRYYGGGIAVEKEAAIDDGCLDLYSLEFDRLGKLALIYPAFRSGRHGLWKDVRTMNCREVEIRTRRPLAINTDGEITTATPARFRIHPKAVSVIAPVPPVAEGGERDAPVERCPIERTA